MLLYLLRLVRQHQTAFSIDAFVFFENVKLTVPLIKELINETKQLLNLEGVYVQILIGTVGLIEENVDKKQE